MMQRASARRWGWSCILVFTACCASPLLAAKLQAADTLTAADDVRAATPRPPVPPLAEVVETPFVDLAAPADDPRMAAVRPPEPNQPTAATLDELVAQLGAESFPQREAAQARLQELNLAARDALLAGLGVSDPEVRRRCRFILADVLAADYQRRLEAFADDVRLEHEHDLYGWRRYRVLVGEGKNERQLFIQMQREELGLLASYEAGPEAAAEAIKARFRTLYQPFGFLGGISGRRQGPNLGQVAALLLVVSDPELTLPEEAVANPYWGNVPSQGSFQEALKNGPLKDPARKLLALWLRAPTSMNILSQKLQLAMQHEEPAGLDLALSALQEKHRRQLHAAYRGYAAMALGGIGGKQARGQLLELLADNSECSRHIIAQGGKQTVHVIQMRDIALAWLIHLTDQDHKDYGQENAKQVFEQIYKHRNIHVGYHQFGFANEEARSAAFERWNKWLAENPLIAPPLTFAEVEISYRTPNFFGGVIVRDGAATEPSRLAGLELADRLQVRALEQARLALARGEHVEAAAVLGEILASPVDYAFQPDRSTPLYRRLRAAAEGLLGSVGAAGREAYSLQFDTLAERDLAQALASGDAAAIEAVAERFLHTPAGAEAAYLAAVHRRTTGQPLRAALLFARLKHRSPLAGHFEPELSLQLTACLSQAGLRQDALAAAADLAARGGRATLGGRALSLAAPAPDLLAEIELLIGAPLRAAAADGWLLPRGDLQRSGRAAASGPHLAGRPLSPLWPSGAWRERAEQLAAERRGERRPTLPASQPLVVGDVAVVRTATEQQAWRLSTGELLWRSPVDDALRELIARGGPPTAIEGELLDRALVRRLWGDSACGLISSDGARVYGVEGLSIGLEGEIERLTIAADGGRQLDTGALRRHNRLVAYDLATGKVLWEAGDARVDASHDLDTAAADPLAGMFFLGPPTPLADRLFVIAEQSDAVVALVELEPATGALLHMQPLSARDASPDASNLNLAMFVPAWALEPAAHRTGASATYADGVLVCPLGPSSFAAVDLASRSVLWLYHAEVGDARFSPNFMNNWQQRLAQLYEEEDADRWVDAGAVLSGGRALLTPSGVDQLICLRAVDGQLLWRSPRRDGLYVAGVQGDEVAIVVGRSNVWGVRLADGELAWQGQAAPLPPGSAPSGRGFVGDRHVYVPLSSGEVAAIELATGRLAAQSRASAGVVPGNLAPAGDYIVSLAPEGVFRFDSLAVRDARLAAARAADADDRQLRLDHAETLLHLGRPAEAIALLRAARELDAAAPVGPLLADAVLEGLRLDYARHEADLALVDRFADDPARRAQWLRRQAEWRRAAGDLTAAFESWLDLAEADPDLASRDFVAAGRSVRRDRELAGHLVDIYLAAGDARRGPLDRLIAERLAADARRWLPLVGFHPAAHPVRIELARHELAAGELLSAEQRLRSVLDAPSRDVAAAPAAAAWQLDHVLRAAGQPLAAHQWRAEAVSRWGAAAADDQRSLADAFAAAPLGDKELHPRRSTDLWPTGRVATDQAQQGGGVQYRYVVPIEDDGYGGRVDLLLEIDMSGRVLRAVDRFGQQAWTLAFSDAATSRRPVSSAVFSHAVAKARGHLLLVWLGDRVVAIDALAAQPKLLWTRDILPAAPEALASQRGVAVPMRLQVQRQWQPLDGAPAPLALCDDAVCFFSQRSLVAVDPLTGDELWSRDDLPLDSDLAGGPDWVGVTPAEREQSLLLDSRDGRTRAHPALPPRSQRLGVFQGHWLLWRTPSDEGVELSLFDPRDGGVRWSHTFAEKTQPHLLDAGRVATLTPAGEFAVVSAATGRVELTAQVEAIDDLESILVFPSTDDLLLVTATRGFDDNSLASNQAGFGFARAHGPLVSIDRATGAVRWRAEAKNQMVRLLQPAESPVLPLTVQSYRIDNNRHQGFTKIAVFERRTGQSLHEAESPQYQFFFDVEPVLDKKSVRIRHQGGVLTFAFDAAEAKE